MVEMSVKTVTVELTTEQIKLCLIALDVFNNLTKVKTLQVPLIELSKQSEKFFGFSFNLKTALSNLDKFQDHDIGLTCDALFDKYEEASDFYDQLV